MTGQCGPYICLRQRKEILNLGSPGRLSVGRSGIAKFGKKWNCRVRVYVILEFFRAWQLILELGCLGTQNMGSPARIKDSEACIFRLMKILLKCTWLIFQRGAGNGTLLGAFF